MKEAWDTIQEEEELFSLQQKNDLASLILSNAARAGETAVPVIQMKPRRRSWLGYAAAVVLLLGACAAIYFSVVRQPDHSATDLAENGNPLKIIPGGERAVLTLADGSQIVLDSAGNGLLAQQGNVQVIKMANGQIAYDPRGAAQSEMMNTMRTPRGGQYQLTLPDGSRVWLNAASSISFPASFDGKQRKVSITGEAYFEVAGNPAQPFLVDIAGQSTVEVLGTSFNINAYRDDESIRSTLVTGGIRVSDNGATQAAIVLKPGQVWFNGKVETTDIARDIAWKNGIFDFSGKSFQSVMKEIERWYDLQVQYKGAIPTFKFSGQMDRGVQLEDLMKFLQQYGLRIQLEGRKLIIAGQQNG
ncbi:MAG: FecR family protein [Pseudobacter sp.]|uniref:FecR family protein n=1 Tax=Pseudobacter sp. TaxID=2045420 RepID=UPI003F809FA7